MQARGTDLREVLDGPHWYEANGITHFVERPDKQLPGVYVLLGYASAGCRQDGEIGEYWQ
jgi:hypothetical protein